jgi:hypothetical protein
MQGFSNASKQRKFDPWFGLSLGMVVISVAGLFYIFLHC